MIKAFVAHHQHWPQIHQQLDPEFGRWFLEVEASQIQTIQTQRLLAFL